MRSFFLFSLLLATMPPMCSQTSAVNIEDVSEPPELTGEPKKLTEPTQADRQLFEIVNHLKDVEETRSTLPTLNKFIEQHPENSDAYFLRATCEACILDSRNLTSIVSDVDAAISHPGAAIYNKTDYYSLLGKIEIERAQYKQAIRGS